MSGTVDRHCGRVMEHAATVSGNFYFHLLGMVGLTTLGAPLAMISAALVTAVHIRHSRRAVGRGGRVVDLVCHSDPHHSCGAAAAERWLPANFLSIFSWSPFWHGALSLASAGVVALFVFAAASDVTAGKALSQYAPLPGTARVWRGDADRHDRHSLPWSTGRNGWQRLTIPAICGCARRASGCPGGPVSAARLRHVNTTAKSTATICVRSMWLPALAPANAVTLRGMLFHAF